ncbi:MAG: hypothetical protein QOH60_3208 [Mycobacterium sp.]|nr:hypothetical protein [Mycobacterium sp.]
MSEIAEIMALFGHIDEIVGEHPDDPSVVETVERMLPGTTGDQQGWYSQIQRLFREISGSESSGLPEYDAAVNRLATRTESPLPITQQAKARYAGVILVQLPGADDYREQLINVLGLTGENQTMISAATGTRMLELIQERPPSHSTWTEFLQEANTRGLVTDDEVQITAPAKGEIRVVGDKIATQLDVTYLSGKDPLGKVKEVLDPHNWPHCCDAWQQVTDATPKTNLDGWTRIYEVIGPDKSLVNLHLTTPLIFHKDRVAGGYLVNYDLDTDHRGTNFDNFVQVDSGFIWARPLPTTTITGSIVQTRKVVAIQGLGASALAMFAYTMGWSTYGEDLILGCSRRLPPGGSPYPWDPAADAEVLADEDTPTPIPKIDGENRKKMIKKAVEVATKQVDERAARTTNILTRWLSGELKPDDLIEISQDAGRAVAASQIDLHKAFVETLVSAADTEPNTVAARGEGEK